MYAVIHTVYSYTHTDIDTWTHIFVPYMNYLLNTPVKPCLRLPGPLRRVGEAGICQLAHQNNPVCPSTPLDKLSK